MSFNYTQILNGSEENVEKIIIIIWFDPEAPSFYFSCEILSHCG